MTEETLRILLALIAAAAIGLGGFLAGWAFTEWLHRGE